MRFRETELAGAFVIELEPHADERGFFARSFCASEFADRGLATRYVQSNLSYNRRAGTLRGMHYQAAPHTEVKRVRCIAGAVYDVIVDLRSDSPTRLAWTGVELSADNRRELYIPEGFAHGFLSLRDDTEVAYEMGASHAPEAARGFRWDDARIAIAWPAEPVVISQRDRSYPDLDPRTLREDGL